MGLFFVSESHNQSTGYMLLCLISHDAALRLWDREG